MLRTRSPTVRLLAGSRERHKGLTSGYPRVGVVDWLVSKAHQRSVVCPFGTRLRQAWCWPKVRARGLERLVEGLNPQLDHGDLITLVLAEGLNKAEALRHRKGGSALWMIRRAKRESVICPADVEGDRLETAVDEASGKPFGRSGPVGCCEDVLVEGDCSHAEGRYESLAG